MDWEVSVWLVCRALTDESGSLNVFVWDSFKGISKCSKPFLISGARRDPCSLTSFYIYSLMSLLRSITIFILNSNKALVAQMRISNYTCI